MIARKTLPILSRRELLETLGLVLASTYVPASRGSASAADEPPRSKPKKLVVVLNSGGWDTTYALDPKPGLPGIDAPEGEVRHFGNLPIFTHPSRPSVDAYFERYGDLTTLVHGLQIRSFVHPDCMKRLLTGSPSETTPDLAAIAAYELGRELPVPYLALGGQARSGPFASITGRTGTTNQLAALIDPLAAYPSKQGALYVPETGLVATADEAALVRTYLEASARRLRHARGQVRDARRIDDFVDSLDRAERLRSFAAKHGAGERNYTLGLSAQIPLAIRALRDGLSHSVLMQTSEWDTHQNNARQSERHQMLFSALIELVEGLDTERLLDDTLVVVLSEMGRTPKLNAEAGKDHWPVTSAMVVGGQVRGNRVIGASSETLEALPVNLESGEPDGAGQQLQASNFVAGVLEAVGVSSARHLPQVTPLRALMPT